MSELSDYWKRLQLLNDFMCKKNVAESNPWDCRECEYFYRSSYGSSRCLKKDIKDWCIYHTGGE